MKKFVFLLLTILLFSLNYGCSKQSGSKKITIEECKNTCSAIDDSIFCSRICEKEIFDQRWKFLGFAKAGVAWFYDLEGLSTFNNTVSVWTKIIYSERAREDVIKRKGKRYKELDFALVFYEINCSQRKHQQSNIIVYAFDGSVIEEISESYKTWSPIEPYTLIEKLFKKVCKK
jgi:hypothetical protein